jgi:hypothetical protein
MQNRTLKYNVLQSKVVIQCFRCCHTQFAIYHTIQLHAAADSNFFLNNAIRISKHKSL